MKWIDYREALGIGFADTNKAEMLSAKIEVFCDELSDVSTDVSRDVCRRYFSHIGERNTEGFYTFYSVQKNILKRTDTVELVSRMVALANASREENYEEIYDYIITALKEFLNDLSINYDIVSDNDGIFVFPKGAQELDIANVSIPFEWLRDYPQARTSMAYALRTYSSGEAPSEVADNFRKALETFAKEFFNNDKSLENQKKIFGEYLVQHGIPKDLSGNFETTLQMYTNFMNNYAKHNNKTSKDYLEFIMYQTGNIIRLVISLEK